MYLFAVTDLEHSYQVNLNVIGGVKRTAIDILKICCLFFKRMLSYIKSKAFGNGCNIDWKSIFNDCIS